MSVRFISARGSGVGGREEGGGSREGGVGAGRVGVGAGEATDDNNAHEQFC